MRRLPPTPEGHSGTRCSDVLHDLVAGREKAQKPESHGMRRRAPLLDAALGIWLVDLKPHGKRRCVNRVTAESRQYRSSLRRMAANKVTAVHRAGGSSSFAFEPFSKENGSFLIRNRHHLPEGKENNSRH
jgi:hypothetical protein